MLRELAPAKVNLALAVTGRRTDGYHLIDTLVVFTDASDVLTAEPAAELSLTIHGRFAGALADSSGNLVLEAAERLRELAGGPGRAPAGAKLTLTKNLPVAAGIGGGSADAAAALRLLNRLWNLKLDKDHLARIGTRIGADVPMCVHSKALRALGSGDRIVALYDIPRLDLVLVNPGVAVSTAAIFAALARREGPGLADLPPTVQAEKLARFLDRNGNDLEESAVAAAPVIANVLEAVRASPECLAARMSGSGATCFGLFPGRAAAVTAAARLAEAHRDWWVVPARAQ